MKICKRFKFSAGHYLPYVADGHQCKRQHGHNYRVDVTVYGKVSPVTGMVMDFADLSSLVKPVVALLEHRNLNDIMDNPTAENVAMWIYTKIGCLEDTTIRVWETDTCYAETCAWDSHQ